MQESQEQVAEQACVLRSTLQHSHCSQQQPSSVVSACLERSDVIISTNVA